MKIHRLWLVGLVNDHIVTCNRESDDLVRPQAVEGLRVTFGRAQAANLEEFVFQFEVLDKP